MSKRKFFIDTDTASDDAVAILMALEWDDVEVLGISIVSGLRRCCETFSKENRTC